MSLIFTTIIPETGELQTHANLDDAIEYIDEAFDEDLHADLYESTPDKPELVEVTFC